MTKVNKIVGKSTKSVSMRFGNVILKSICGFLIGKNQLINRFCKKKLWLLTDIVKSNILEKQNISKKCNWVMIGNYKEL